ncbi:MAG: hypothetical protein AB1298_04715, partial [Bacteroidota bacterium]
KTGFNISNEKWVLPAALMLKAKAKFFSGSKEEAKNLLKDAEDNNDFEFKDYIQSQIEWLKRRLVK